MLKSLPKAKQKILIFGRWFIAFSAILAILIIFLLERPGIRRPLINSLIKVPEYTTFVMIRRAITSYRDFEQVNLWLNRELDLADWYAPGHNQLIPGLLNNSRHAINRIRFREEFKAVRPFLEKLVKSQPDLFLARLWLGRALSKSNPEKAFEQLDMAFRLSSANPGTYRTAFDIALRLKDSSRLNEWCDRYLKSQFGGSQFPEHTSPFSGTGLRKLLLEIIGEKGSRQRISNVGIQLGDSRDYEFALPQKIHIETLRLHLSVLAGIKIKLTRVKLFKAGKLIDDLQDELVLTSLSGFHVEDGSVFAATGDGEVINIYSSLGFRGQVDKVVITLGFDRLGLASPSPCKKGGS
ncbi:MAG: hypothetical protein HOJ79_12000 [Nitrospina sp.]|jgi:hypothetical protein|nr:hypothetical protein [Nitrospina sp.]